MYWYNVRTGKVETDVQHDRKDHLMGPYKTAAEAAMALQTAAAKTEAWDEEDREWENWGENPQN